MLTNFAVKRYFHPSQCGPGGACSYLKTLKVLIIFLCLTRFSRTLTCLRYFRPSNHFRRFQYELNSFYPSLSVRTVQFHLAEDAHKECQGFVWFLVTGHLRSFGEKMPNFKSFVHPAKCYFLLLYTRAQFESPTRSWWKRGVEPGENKTNVDAYLRNMFAEDVWLSSTNYAYAVVEQDASGVPRTDLFTGVRLLQKFAELEQDLRKARADTARSADIFVFLRPDLLFSKKIEYGRLHHMARAYMNAKRGFGFFIRHEAERYGGWDPSELFWVTNRALFESLFDMPTPVTSADPFYTAAVHGCCYHGLGSKNVSHDSCGSDWASRLLFRSCRLGHDVFFARGDLKIHILRMNGNYKTAINRPGNADEVHPANAISGSLDITKQAEHLIGGLDRHCLKSESDESPSSTHLTLNHDIKCFPRPGSYSDGSCAREDVTFHMYSKSVHDAVLYVADSGEKLAV